MKIEVSEYVLLTTIRHIEQLAKRYNAEASNWRTQDAIRLLTLDAKKLNRLIKKDNEK